MTLADPELSSAFLCAESGVLDLSNEGGETVLVIHSHVGENLAVEGDAGLLQTVHEHRVAQAIGAAAGVDTSDPQTAEHMLLVAAVTIAY